jgi:hypothetical protein
MAAVVAAKMEMLRPSGGFDFTHTARSVKSLSPRPVSVRNCSICSIGANFAMGGDNCVLRLHRNRTLGAATENFKVLKTGTTICGIVFKVFP